MPQKIEQKNIGTVTRLNSKTRSQLVKQVSSKLQYFQAANKENNTTDLLTDNSKLQPKNFFEKFIFFIKNRCSYDTFDRNEKVLVQKTTEIIGKCVAELKNKSGITRGFIFNNTQYLVHLEPEVKSKCSDVKFTISFFDERSTSRPEITLHFDNWQAVEKFSEQLSTIVLNSNKSSERIFIIGGDSGANTGSGTEKIEVSTEDECKRVLENLAKEGSALDFKASINSEAAKRFSNETKCKLVLYQAAYKFPKLKKDPDRSSKQIKDNDREKKFRAIDLFIRQLPSWLMNPEVKNLIIQYYKQLENGSSKVDPVINFIDPKYFKELYWQI